MPEFLLRLDPAVVQAILQTLLDGLVMYKPLSLKLTPGLKHTLDSIQSFAKEMLSVSTDTRKSLQLIDLTGYSLIIVCL